MINYDEKCQYNMSCMANIYPLDPKIELRSCIKGDKYCKHIMFYLEGRETPFKREIKATEAIWKEKIGEKNLDSRLASRKRAREMEKKWD